VFNGKKILELEKRIAALEEKLQERQDMDSMHIDAGQLVEAISKQLTNYRR
jgi:hypothetical protein